MSYIVLDDKVLAGSESLIVMGGLGGILIKFKILAAEFPAPLAAHTPIRRNPKPLGTFKKLTIISFEVLEIAFTRVITPAIFILMV